MTTKLKTWIALCTLALGNLLHAGCPDPCPCYDPCECYSSEDTLQGAFVYADWLYWKVRGNNLDYALRSAWTLNPEESRDSMVYGVCPDWNSGFRVGAGKECDCFTYALEYTYFKNRYRDSRESELVSTRGLNPTTLFGSASGEYRVDLDLVQATLGSNVCFSECLDTFFYTGFKYAKLLQRLNATYYFDPELDAFEAVSTKIALRGYGMTFGITPVYKILSCLDLMANLSFDAYAANQERSTIASIGYDEGSTVINKIDDRGCWDLIGTINLSVGINYLLQNPCGEGEIILALGYEFHEWINTPGFLSLTSTFDENENATSVSIDRHNSDLGFDGLYLRLAASF